MRLLMLFAIAFFFAQPALAAPRATVTWRYERADDARSVNGRERVRIPKTEGRELIATDPGIVKTILLADIANGVRHGLKNYENACTRIERPDTRIFIPPSPVPRTCATRETIASSLQNKITDWNARALENAAIRSDREMMDLLDLLRTLAQNMKEARPPVGGFEGPILRHSVARVGTSFGGPGLGVLGGGAQGFGYFKKIVQNGRVPKSDVLTVEGLLREFDLPLTSAPPCHTLVCVNPAVAVHPKTQRLYVQLGMNSAVTEETFERDPLNLAVVLDISGSMSATDGTEKSRLEWAKDALVQTIRMLDEKDVLSIVTFDTTSEIRLKPLHVRDRNGIIKIVRGLEARGTTNLEAGLRDGYQLAADSLEHLPNHEHRVILISDAGLNTGVTETAALQRLVSRYARQGIGLTALGMGQNFNQEFIHAISNSRGGNYLFVQTGREMQQYFDAFNFLVTPIAYDFHVRLDIEGLDAKLVAAYGVTTEGDMQPARPVIDLETLFFSKARGAILLEYELRETVEGGETPE